MTQIQTQVTTIQELFEGHLSLTQTELREEFARLDNYEVPVDQASDIIIENYAEKHDIPLSTLYNTSPETTIEEIDAADEWGSYTVTVTDLWPPTHETIDQVGLLADRTGKVRFTKWADATHLQQLEKGESYLIESAVTTEYNDNYSLSLTDPTQITQLDTSVTSHRGRITIRGALVNLQTGSGVIERCQAGTDGDRCRNPLSSGVCPTHGECDSSTELRLKAVIDDGTETHNLVFHTDGTEMLTGIDTETAVEIETKHGETALLEAMKAEFIGRYFTITCSVSTDYHVVKGYEEVREPQETESTLNRAQTYHQ